MSDTSTAPTQGVPMTSIPAPAGTEYVRRRGRPRRVADADLRSVVVACRVDPATADALSDRAEAYGQERATLLASLVTAELSRPAPRRRKIPQPTVQVEVLAETLGELEGAKGELRKVHGTLLHYLSAMREMGRDDLAGAMIASLDLGTVDDLVLRVEGLANRTEALIERAEGRHVHP